ncbi:LOW QUALITY PROTEIN: hypothetical protein U9M48_008863 [Paspalum notatum var. saurae]|uniref:Transposase-associated domain-containing protein n=1 Tax=Paspalum notatum var. saurae TaxID=547442 RepID=A0AAQ3WE32_PASNO
MPVPLPSLPPDAAASHLTLVMDRSWMTKPKREAAYQDGVEQFLAFAYRDLPHDSEILCPCKICKNRVNHSLDEVRTHLRCDGILRCYTTWIHHREHYDVTNNTMNLSSFGVPSGNVVHDHLQGNDAMQDLLHAAFCRADLYESLPVMSEGEEAGADVDVNLADDDSVTKEQNIYATFLKDADTMLYPGCKFSSYLTLYHLKCHHGWTQESFTSLLGVLSTALPIEENLPKTYYEAKKIIHGLDLGYVKIHACPKDCMLFRGDAAKQEFCHVSKSSRSKEDKKNGSTSKQKKKKSQQKLFSTVKTSDDMRWHDEGRTKDGKLRHPSDDEAWRDFDVGYPDFCSRCS